MTKASPQKDPSRAREADAPVIQDAPTQPPERSHEGYELADDGLPKCGPARARALAAKVKVNAEVTEKSDG